MFRQIILLIGLFSYALAPAFAATLPIVGPDGVWRYPFGDRTPTTLQCAPLTVCDLVLDPGESIINVAVGDSVRWLIAPASSGAADAITPHVLVKPTQSGLRTNLIITTNRRTYYLMLISRDNDPMLRIGFLYPQDVQRQFSAGTVSTAASVAPISTAIDKLDFNYRMAGDRSIQPLRVFNDGSHTYLQMPTGMADIPVLFAVGADGSDTLVNYRVAGSYYVVDAVPTSITLVQGSGKTSRRALVTRGN